MSFCAPNIDKQDHYTCFTMEELENVAKSFNNYIKKNKQCPIKISNNKSKSGGNNIDYCLVNKKIRINGKTKKELWESIYNRLKSVCTSEYCWLDLDFIKHIDDNQFKEKIIFFTFKPKMTFTRDQWLNTQDINNVLQQYQELNPNFKFLGALPSDFYKITKVDYSKIFDYKKLAIVFNLDEHDQRGSHWVAFIIDNSNKTLEYYDSTGKLPNKNIKYFINIVWKYLQKHDLNYKIYINKTKHQHGNSECGVYSIYFIIQRFLGFDFKYITENVILDEQMNKFRDIIFRPYN